MKNRLMRTFVVLIVIALFLGTTVQITFPTMPVYLGYLGMDFQLLGLSSMVLALSALIFRPLAGYLINRKGAMATVLYGAVVYLPVFLIYLVVKEPMLILMVRVFQGLGLSLVSTALGAAVVQILPKERLLEGLGFFSLANSLSGTIGVAFGFMLIRNDRFENMFIAGLVMTTVALVMTILLIRSLPSQAPLVRLEKKGLRGMLANPALGAALIAIMLMLAQSSVANFLSFFGKANGLESVGFFFLVNTVGIVASRIFLRPFLKAFGMYRAVILAGILYSASFIGLVLFKGVIPWSLLSVSYGFGYGIVYTVLNTEAMIKVTDENRGNANALFYAAVDMGFALGSIGWGIVGSILGMEWIFYLAFLLALGATIATARKTKETAKLELRRRTTGSL
jgi:MFS family permease